MNGWEQRLPVLELKCGVCGSTLTSPYMTSGEKAAMIDKFQEAHYVCRAEAAAKVPT